MTTKTRRSAKKPSPLDEVAALLRELGALEDPDAHAPFRLMTSLGWLDVSMWDDNICTAFEEPARAVERFGSMAVNRFSGKWNFHGFDQFDRFKEEIRHIAQPLPEVARTVVATPKGEVRLPGEWEPRGEGRYALKLPGGNEVRATVLPEGIDLEGWPAGEEDTPGRFRFMGALFKGPEDQMAIDLHVSRAEWSLARLYGRTAAREAASPSP